AKSDAWSAMRTDVQNAAGRHRIQPLNANTRNAACGKIVKRDFSQALNGCAVRRGRVEEIDERIIVALNIGVARAGGIDECHLAGRKIYDICPAGAGAVAEKDAAAVFYFCRGRSGAVGELQPALIAGDEGVGCACVVGEENFTSFIA